MKSTKRDVHHRHAKFTGAGWARPIKAGSERCELGLVFDLGPMEPMGNSHSNSKSCGQLISDSQYCHYLLSVGPGPHVSPPPRRAGPRTEDMPLAKLQRRRGAWCSSKNSALLEELEGEIQSGRGGRAVGGASWAGDLQWAGPRAGQEKPGSQHQLGALCAGRVTHQ